MCSSGWRARRTKNVRQPNHQEEDSKASYRKSLTKKSSRLQYQLPIRNRGQRQRGRYSRVVQFQERVFYKEISLYTMQNRNIKKASRFISSVVEHCTCNAKVWSSTLQWSFCFATQWTFSFCHSSYVDLSLIDNNNTCEEAWYGLPIPLTPLTLIPSLTLASCLLQC